MLIHVVTVVVKELRELLHRPLLVVTLILGPLVILIVFGIGSDASPRPPRAIVVVPPGQPTPRLVQDYRQQFDESLVVTEYTDDEEGARRQLARNTVDAVLILPPTPFETIATGQPATIKVLYNEIDPLWRGLVPRFVRGLAGEINRAIFLQTASAQRDALNTATDDLDSIIDTIDTAVAAADQENWREVREQIAVAMVIGGRLSDVLQVLGSPAEPLQSQVDRARARLEDADQLLSVVESAVATPQPEPVSEQLGLVQTQRSLQALRSAINAYTTVPPEVVIAPLAVQTELVARHTPDFITFFAPAIVALLIQHVAVSLCALALVRERLSGTFDLYAVAPIAPVELLIGKYLAYLIFTMALTTLLVIVLLVGLNVPLFGSVFRLAVALLLQALASIGIGFVLSLLATSERQAVQFSMLALLGVVFFSGFALPLDALRQPALSVSYVMPATYGVVLLQDVMLRGLPGSDRSLQILSMISAILFVACYGLLRWRTRAV